MPTPAPQRKDWTPKWPARVVKGNSGRDDWKLAVSRDSSLTPMSRLVAHIISGYWNVDTAWTYVGTQRLADSVGITHRNIHRHVQELVAAGYLHRESNGRGRRMFTALTTPQTSIAAITSDGGEASDGSEAKPVTVAKQTSDGGDALTPVNTSEQVSAGGSSRAGAGAPPGRPTSPARIIIPLEGVPTKVWHD